jgi:hypothetical protein
MSRPTDWAVSGIGGSTCCVAVVEVDFLAVGVMDERNGDGWQSVYRLDTTRRFNWPSPSRARLENVVRLLSPAVVEPEYGCRKMLLNRIIC